MLPFILLLFSLDSLTYEKAGIMERLNLHSVNNKDKLTDSIREYAITVLLLRDRVIGIHPFCSNKEAEISGMV